MFFTHQTQYQAKMSARTPGRAYFSRWLMVFVFVLGWVQSALVQPVRQVNLSVAFKLHQKVENRKSRNVTVHLSMPGGLEQMAGEAELMDEDDDESRRSQEDIQQTVYQFGAFDECRYANSLKSRLIQLEAGIRERVELAHFIRYHSWKSDPC